MYYDFAYFLEEYLDSGVFLLNLVTNSISSLWGIAMYVLTSLGLYTIAKRRAISKAWLAWIPVVNCWLIGCISDQYRYVVKGQVKSKRKSLLTLTIVQMALVLAFVAALTVTIVCGVNVSMAVTGYSRVLESIMVPAIVTLGLLLPIIGVGIAKMVVYYMAMYDLYTSCSPENNVLFLVLSIVFRVTEPFFIFFNRKNDKGMPPRRVSNPEM